MAQLLALLLGGLRGLGGLGFGHSLLELVHPAGGIDKFLLPRVERMANIANTNQNRRLGRARLNHVAASATYLRVLVFRMDILLHKSK